jgi:hypothetical protein
MSEDYQRPKAEEILLPNDGTKRTLESLRKTMEQKGLDYQEVWQSIKDTCEKTMAIYGPMI